MPTKPEYYLKNKERIDKSNAERKKQNLDKYLRIGRDWHLKDSKANPEKYLWKNCKARARKKKLEFTILISDIIIPEFCPILGVRLDKTNRKYSPSVDRIDPTKGYTKDNIWVISQIANAMKWDATKEELILFGKWTQTLEKESLP